MHFFDDLRKFGSAVALTDGAGTHWSYDRLADEAEVFEERLGRPRLVFLEARNSFDTFAAYLACLRGGHVVYPFSSQDLGEVERLRAIYQPDVVATYAGDGLAFDWSEVPPRDFAPGLRLLLSTSGSTGSAKFVKLSGHNIHSNAAAIAEYLALDSRSRAITALKPSYSYGLSVVNSHLFAGGSLLLTELSVTDAGFWEAFGAGGADSFAGVPFTFEVLDRMGIRLAGIEGLRYASQAGGRLAPALVRKFARDAQGAGRRFHVMYGQTEAAPRIAHLPADLAEAHPDSIGVSIPGGSIELVGDDGALVEAVGVPGQLAYRGPNVMMGYASDPAGLATDETPARLMTGDIACRSAEGLFTIVGRVARFVKPFGIRVNLDEVEAWVRGEVGPCACVGDDRRIVLAFGGADGVPSGPQAVAARTAARFKLPTHVVECRVLDRLPLLESGKIDYRTISAICLSPPVPVSRMQALRSWLGLLFSRDFARQTLVEAKLLLGLGQRGWDGIAGVFAHLLNRADVSDEDRFVDLAGDSLTYIQVALAIEEYLGFLPEGWEYMSVSELEAVHEQSSL